MQELTDYPEIKKLLELGEEKKELTFDEINQNLPLEIVEAERIDDVLILLQFLRLYIIHHILFFLIVHHLFLYNI